MFRTVPLSIIRSFSLYTQQWYMSYRFSDSLQAGLGWNSLPSSSCLRAVSKPVWHIPLQCVQWKTNDGQRNCPKHVEFHSKNNFEKSMHLVGFIIRNLSRYTVTWTSNLTPWMGVFKKLIYPQIFKKFTSFYGTHRSNTVLATTCYWSIPWAKFIQSAHFHSVSLGPILILSCPQHLGVPSGFRLSSIPTKTLYAFICSPICAKCFFHLIACDLINRIIFRRDGKFEVSRSVLICVKYDTWLRQMKKKTPCCHLYAFD